MKTGPLGLAEDGPAVGTAGVLTGRLEEVCMVVGWTGADEEGVGAGLEVLTETGMVE